jgi:DnaJ-class molecular chaperone
MRIPEEDYYAILGVDRDADHDAIRRAYHKQAMRWHPDKNQEQHEEAERKFKEIAEAYDVLSDPEMRALFDEYGASVLKGADSPTHSEGGEKRRGRFHYVFDRDPQEMFADFFKGDTGMARRVKSLSGLGLSDIFGGPDLDMMHESLCASANRANGSPSPVDPVVTVKLRCTLEDLYAGVPQRFLLKRKNLTLNRPVEKLLEVPLKRGWKTGTKLTFEGEGDEYAPGRCQDLVFLVAAMPHKHFTRAGSDLVYHSRIPLVDALTGFTMEVPTLDNRLLQVVVRDVVHPKYTQVIKGEGMPISKEPGTHGDLILTFDIVWPTELDDDQKHALLTCLPR